MNFSEAQRKKVSHCAVELGMSTLDGASSSGTLKEQDVPRSGNLVHLVVGTEGFDSSGELCILKDRLYLASLPAPPAATGGKYYLSLSKKMRYVPFCAGLSSLFPSPSRLWPRLGSAPAIQEFSIS